MILRGGAYPGLSEWDLHAITNVLIRKRQREEGQMGEENTQREPHRGEDNVKTEQGEKRPPPRIADSTGSWQRQGRTLL